MPLEFSIPRNGPIALRKYSNVHESNSSNYTRWNMSRDNPGQYANRYTESSFFDQLLEAELCATRSSASLMPRSSAESRIFSEGVLEKVGQQFALKQIAEKRRRNIVPTGPPSLGRRTPIMTRHRSTFPAGQPADPDEPQVEFDRRVARLLIASSANFIPISAAWLVDDWSLLPELGRGLSPSDT